MMPGDPTSRYVAEGMSLEEREELIKIFGLDESLYTQYIRYIINVFKGDMGISFLYYPSRVWNVIIERLPWTVLLLGTSIGLSMIVGVILGSYSAWNYGKKFDSIVTMGSLVLRTVPSFWLGMIFLLVFGYYLRLFPLSGSITVGVRMGVFERILDIIKHLMLPVFTLMAYLIAGNIYLVRASLLDVLPEQYIVTAKAKGLKNRTILYKHGLRSGIIPVITWFTLQFGYIVSGAVLIETVFSFPGTGKLIYDAALARDYPLLQGAFLILTATVLIAMFILDLIYAILDPRIKKD
jgi:peptide/nickel transport system permease protein